MLLSETVVIALITVTTGIVVSRRKKKGEQYFGYFIAGAIFSWILLFFYIFFAPNTILISGQRPITAGLVEALIVFLIIMVEGIGFYFLGKG